MKWIYNDGGREAAGYRGACGDCVTRAVAIATGQPYRDVYLALAEINLEYRSRKRKSFQKRSARNGIPTRAAGFKRYMQGLGWEWVPTMGIGTGCRVHLRSDELPHGRLIVMLSKHCTAVVDGVIHDTYDPQRLAVECADADKEDVNGSRCVYGYWRFSRQAGK